MLDSHKQELDDLMNRFKDDQSGLQQKKQEEKAGQEAFVKEFERLKKETIWPVFVEIGNQLNQYGHDYHVEEQQETVDATAHYEPARIVFNIYPATVGRSFYTPESTPYICFQADRYAKKVAIIVSTMMPNEGGTIGTHGQYGIGEITADSVEKEVVEVLKNSLIFHKENS